MTNYLIVFICGLIEQIGYTLYLLSVDKRKVFLSSIIMFFYFSFYLIIIAYAIKHANTIPLLLTYSLSTGIGNFIVMKYEVTKKRKKENEKSY